MSDIKLKHDGWMVVADGEKALFLRNEGDEKYPNLTVFRELAHENPPDREQGADRPGRLSDGGVPASGAPGAGNVHRSAVQETDWHRVEKQRFAREIAERLYKHAHAGRFSDLIVVAPPAILGDMRKEFHKEVQDCIVAEMDKDLTNHPVEEMVKIVLNYPE